MQAVALWTAIFGLVVACGCAHYEPKPLHPERSLQELQARRLTDPDVQAAIRAGTPASGSSSPLTMNRAQLLLAALHLNPGLAQARAQLVQSTEGIRTASALQNPTISLASEYDLSSAGEPTWLWGIGTSFLLDAIVSRKLRTQIARAGVRGARADFNDAIWAVRREVRAAFLTTVVASRRAALLELDARQRSDLAILAHRRLEAGESAAPEARQADLESPAPEPRWKMRVARVSMPSRSWLPQQAFPRKRSTMSRCRGTTSTSSHPWAPARLSACATRHCCRDRTLNAPSPTTTRKSWS
ncbi:MAG: TolC family protein [Gammaproteobacteria bacterium]